MGNRTFKIVLSAVVVLFMANLNALIDLFFHPQIPYFDKEHLLTGGITALVTLLLLGFLWAQTARYAALTEELNRQNLILKEQTIRDGLTGLYNHRHFHEMLRHEFLLAQRHDADLACLMLDLDFFKKVNDSCGHPFGDQVLKATAELISKETRVTDTVARYGGEEFAVLLPNTDLKGAMAIAERIRSKAADHVHRHSPHAEKVTLSIGVATLKDSKPRTPDELLSLADQALYRAKEKGRNRVEAAPSRT